MLVQTFESRQPNLMISQNGRTSNPDSNGAHENLRLYCREKTGGRGSSIYYATLFLPPEHGTYLLALHAYRNELDEAADETAETDLARLKLHWWREEIDRTFVRRPRHPVTRALAPAILRYSLPIEPFLELIEGCSMKLGLSVFASTGQLLEYCRRTGTMLETLAATILGFEDRATLDYARELGTALRLANILTQMGADARRHRVLAPQDDLSRFGLQPHTLLHEASAENTRLLVERQFDRAWSAHDRALSLLACSERLRQAPGLIAAAISRATLEEIRKDGFRVLERKIELTPLRKFWIAWNTQRRARRESKVVEP